MPTPIQQQLIQSLFTWTCQHLYASLFATVLEDGLRGELLNKSLLSGWELAINKGTPIRKIKLLNGVLSDQPSKVPATPGHNPDMRIVAPENLRVELKVRGLYGSSITAPNSGINGDFSHVYSGSADAFILASDIQQYTNLRTGNGKTSFSNELPSTALLTNTASTLTVSRIEKGVTKSMLALAQRVSSPFGERIAAAFYMP